MSKFKKGDRVVPNSRCLSKFSQYFTKDKIYTITDREGYLRPRMLVVLVDDKDGYLDEDSLDDYFTKVIPKLIAGGKLI